MSYGNRPHSDQIYTITAHLADLDLYLQALSRGPQPRTSAADLSGADLSAANLFGAHLTGAHLTGAHLTRAYWPADAPVPVGWKLDTSSGRLERAGTGSGPTEAN